MSTEFIERYADKRRTIFSTSEPKSEQIAKLSHLFINGKRVASIGDLKLCSKNLRVIYLHNNAIRTIENLNNLNALTHIYLQNNQIGEINNLNGLPNLTKLYLGMNRIRALANLSEVPKLKELHIERQRLEANETFTFDEQCLRNLSGHLQLINIEGLQLTSLEDITILHRLKQLLAADNQFACPMALGSTLEKLPNLRTAYLHGCPAQKHLYYREHILQADQIDNLDGQAIPRSTRNFIKNFAIFKAKKLNHQIQSKQSNSSKELTAGAQTHNFGINEISFDLLPKPTVKLNRTRSIRRLTVSAIPLQNPSPPRVTLDRNYSCVSDYMCHKINIL